MQGARVPQGPTTTTASYHDIGPRQPRKYDYSLEEFEGQPSRSVNRDKGETVESPVKLEGGRFEVTNTLVSTLHLDNVRKVHYTTLFKCRAGLATKAIILCSLFTSREAAWSCRTAGRKKKDFSFFGHCNLCFWCFLLFFCLALNFHENYGNF